MAENEVKRNELSAKDLGLTEQQKKFCEYYMRSKSGGDSYKKAFDPDGTKGIKMNSCYTNANRLLKKEKIQNYLTILRNEIKKKNVMEAEDIIAELVEIATNVGEKTSDKLRALELLGRSMALFQDKVQMDSNSTIEINLLGVEENELKVIEAEPVREIESKDS